MRPTDSGRGLPDRDTVRRGSFGAALRQLYGGSAPSGPATGALRATNADNLVVRSRAYRRLRAWIVSRGLSQTTIFAIRLLHTAIFAQLMGFVLVVTASGLRNRFTRWTRLALLGVAGEAAVVLLNRGRCPLTVVVEDLGAEHGSVSDILLPDWAARHIPHISTGLLALGFATLGIRRVAAARRGSGPKR